MPLTPEEELEMMELEKARAMALSKPIPEHRPEEEKTFFQGLKAGITAQPGEGVGHFIGAAFPATVGGALAGPAAPVGAALGEAARQTLGAIVNPEETAKKSPLAIGAEVAGAGVGQKVGEALGPAMGKVGTGIKNVSEWLGSRIGKGFLKASKSLNAYGHLPEKAIKDEGIIAYSWDDLVGKTKLAKHEVGEAMDDVISNADKDVIANVNDVLKPIDDALSEARKFPTENATLISRLEGLKSDTMGLLHKGDKTGQMLNVDRANSIKKSLYRVTKYRGTDADEIPLNKVKQDVARNIAKKIEEVTPEIKPLKERYGNLVALENAATNRAIVAERSDFFGLPEMLGLGVAGIGGVSGVAPGAAIIVGNRLLKTPLGGTIGSQVAPMVGKAAEAGISAIGKGAEKLVGGISAATIDAGAEMERNDHPQLSQQQAEEVAQQELQKDKEGYTKEIKKFERKAE